MMTLLGVLRTRRALALILLISGVLFLGAHQVAWATPGQVATTTLPFVSRKAEDGHIQEKDDTGTGLKVNDSNKQFFVGDDKKNRQYLGILSFDTSSIPDDVTLEFAVVQIKLKKVKGDPFDGSLGDLILDTKDGAFFDNKKLQKQDFDAASCDQNTGTFVPIGGDVYEAVLDTGELGCINLSGLTQFRIRFKIDDDGDFVADQARFASGDNDNSNDDQPMLIVGFTTPP